MTNILSLLQDASNQLSENNRCKESVYLEARLLLCKTLNCSLEQLIRDYNTIVDDKTLKKYMQLISRRVRHEPIAYILGYKEFYGLKFIVNKNVLIPRPDTEVLIDAIMGEYYQSYNHNKSCANNLSILDLGTGSGVLAITLAKQIKNSYVVATDISEKALDVARKNAKLHQVQNKIHFVRGDWFKALANNSSVVDGLETSYKFDIIVSNPPYISSNEMNLITKETELYEPQLALMADEDGTSCYREIISSTKQYLRAGGSLVLEWGFNQQQKITPILESHNFNQFETFTDIQSHVRAIKAKYV